LVTGSNGTGKSTIVEIMGSIFEQKIRSRWNKPEVNFNTEINLDNPVLSKFSAHIENNQLSFTVGKTKQPFVPYDFFVLCLNGKIRDNSDDLKTIANCFGLERSFVKAMLKTTGIKHGLVTRKMEIVESRTKPYPVDKL